MRRILIVTITLFLWTLFGCRFGNRVEYAPPEDPYSGYYVTQPQSLIFYVTTSGTQFKSVPISAVPSEISQVMTNPVALILHDSQTGRASVVSVIHQLSLPTFLGQDLSLSFNGSTPAQTYWQDSQCQSFLEVLEEGQLIQTQNFEPPPKNTLKISGKIRLRIQMITQFQGNCTPTFQAIAECYRDYSLCGGRNNSENQGRQSQIITLFQPMIEAGVLAPESIPEITNYAYEVSYE